MPKKDPKEKMVNNVPPENAKGAQGDEQKSEVAKEVADYQTRLKKWREDGREGDPPEHPHDIAARKEKDRLAKELLEDVKEEEAKDPGAAVGDGTTEGQ